VEQLSFYESLPEGKQPLGSGVNLPPSSEQMEAEVPVGSSSVVETLSEPAVKEPAPDKATPTEMAKVAAQSTTTDGGFVVQVASVKKKDGAEGLRKRLAGKGYGAFVERADLGASGVWYRVYAGPYRSRAEAEQAVASLRAGRLVDSFLIKKR
jgi:cell division septation protein DedD